MYAERVRFVVNIRKSEPIKNYGKHGFKIISVSVKLSYAAVSGLLGRVRADVVETDYGSLKNMVLIIRHYENYKLSAVIR